MTYRQRGAAGCTRVPLTRGRRRVLLALLSGAGNLDGRTLCMTAQVGVTRLYPFLDHLEEAHWATRTPRPGTYPRRYDWALTPQGRVQATWALKLMFPC